MTDYTCIIEHTDDTGTAYHGRLCRRHYNRLARDLDDIGVLWVLLGDLAEPGRGGDSRGKRTSPPAPCRLDVTDLTDPRTSLVIHAVGGWARIVVEERQLSLGPASVHDAARLLTHHLDWVAEQPWIDEAIPEIGDAARLLRHAAGDLPPKPIGTCVADYDGEVCDGPLYYRDGHVVCARCRDTWGPQDLRHMARVVDVYLPVAYAAGLAGVTARAVQKWVLAGDVRRLRHGIVHVADTLKRAGVGA